MATAFTGTIVMKAIDGTVQADKFSSTDVTAAYVTFASTGGSTTLEVLKDCVLSDIITNITTAGTTLDFKLYLNQRDTNIRWVQSANFPTVDNRFLNNAPIPLAKGSKLQIQVIT